MLGLSGDISYESRKINSGRKSIDKYLGFDCCDGAHPFCFPQSVHRVVVVMTAIIVVHVLAFRVLYFRQLHHPLRALPEARGDFVNFL